MIHVEHPADPSRPVVNALTIDVEDYFHVSAFDAPGRRAQWANFESRVERATDRLLELFEAASVTATFFVLGWVAERHPALVRRIAGGGHELASHGYAHQLVYDMTPAAFREDLRRAHGAIGDASGVEVRGYRAPSFSVTSRSLWAIDVLIEEGYAYDSSIYPIFRDRYGLPGAPRFAHTIVRQAGCLLELPPSTVRVAGLTLPVGGGGYFRLYPFVLTRRAVASLNSRDHRPAIVYLHPWEIDPDQPRQAGSACSRLRHYVNLRETEARLVQLLRLFPFGPMSALLPQAAARASVVRTAAAPMTVLGPPAWQVRS